MSKINNSLNYIKETNYLQDNLLYNTQIQPSLNFTALEKEKSAIKCDINDKSRITTVNTDFLKESDVLKANWWN